MMPRLLWPLTGAVLGSAAVALAWLWTVCRDDSLDDACPCGCGMPTWGAEA